MIYQLIKEYPNSPTLGAIATKGSMHSYYDVYPGTAHVYKEHVQDFPEFWERKKNSVDNCFVLSLKNNLNMRILRVLEDGNTLVDKKEYSHVGSFPEGKHWRDRLPTFSIQSVKLFSGLEVSVGDTVRMRNESDAIYKVMELYIKKENVRVIVEKDSKQYDYKVNNIVGLALSLNLTFDKVESAMQELGIDDGFVELVLIKLREDGNS